MSKQDISTFWELFSLPFSLENKNFQPVLLIYLNHWDNWLSAEKGKVTDYTTPCDIKPSHSFPIATTQYSLFFTGYGGRGGLAGLHLLNYYFVTLLQTYAFYSLICG